MATFKEKGQALLIVILIMVVSLTVGLSIASKTITNLRTSNEEENSQRAFSAAEAGIEKALKLGTGSTGGFNNASNFSVTSSPVSGKWLIFNEGNPIEQNEGVDVWYYFHKDDGSIDYLAPHVDPGSYFNVYWGRVSEACNNSAAIEVIVVMGTSASDATTKRFAFDPCSRGNNFATPETYPGSNGSYFVVDNQTFRYKTPVSFSLNGLNVIMVRVVPLYARTPLSISTYNPSDKSLGGVNLPEQGKRIDSTGQAGGTVRKISVFQGYPKLPSEFFYSLFKAVK